MQLNCPTCGTRDVHVSHVHGLGEFLKGLVGLSKLRCRRCNHHWQTSVWANGSWRYARCPRCYRQELTKWTARHYNPPHWTQFLLLIGATPHRCEACRCNFAGFKPRKGSFAWRHQVRAEAVARTPDQMIANQETALLAGQTPPVEESREQMP
jgi:hypothetical protein